MRLLIFCIILTLTACNDVKESSKFIELENATKALLENKEANFELEVIDDAKALISRANIANYKLVDTDFVNKNLSEAIVVSTFESQKQIPNAKVFTFAKAISLNDDGTDWNWELDGIGKSIDDFKNILGDDKDKLIIFYDSGEDIFSPAGSAHTALIWAKHLGYNNTARFIGGLNAWVDSGF